MTALAPELVFVEVANALLGYVRAAALGVGEAPRSSAGCFVSGSGSSLCASWWSLPWRLGRLAA